MLVCSFVGKIEIPRYYRNILINIKNTGSGGIGLAAIRIALAYGLEVFTTVSTPQKKKFILSLFPQLKGLKPELFLRSQLNLFLRF